MTAAAALVAALFAWFNFDLVRQGRENLYTTQEQAYTQFMPVISFDLLPEATLQEFHLTVANIGPGPALNIRFQQHPANLINEKMTEPTYELVIPYVIDTGRHDSVFSLMSGEKREISLKVATNQGDIWGAMKQHPHYGGDRGVTDIGYVEANYEHIDRSELRSSAHLEWYGFDQRMALWGTGLTHRQIRPDRLPVVDTRHWYSFPLNWFKRLEN